MNFIQKIFALKKIPPFTELRDMELSLVAKVSREQIFQPGQIVAGSGTILSSLYVVLEGSIELEDGHALPAVVGTNSLLFDNPLSGDVVSDKNTGAHCLRINKEHFFTIVNECPSFVVGLMKIAYREGTFV